MLLSAQKTVFYCFPQLTNRSVVSHPVRLRPLYVAVVAALCLPLAHSVAFAQAYDFWDGGNIALHDNNVIDGGDGIWKVGERTWTSQDGAVNGPIASPSSPVFQGTPGKVTVDVSAGNIEVTGMQFAVDGYRIEGGPIRMLSSEDSIVVRVGDGSPAGAAMKANIASVLYGDVGLVKTDNGTLILAGENQYEGSTQVRAGWLGVQRHENLGANRSRLILDGGGLVALESFSTDRVIDLAQNSSIAVDAGKELELTGLVSGDADLTKIGDGTLTILAGDYRNTIVQAGVLVSKGNDFKGDLINNARTEIRHSTSSMLFGNISGTGVMVKGEEYSLFLLGSGDQKWIVEDGQLVADAKTYFGDTQIDAIGEFRLEQIRNYEERNNYPYRGVLTGKGTFTKFGLGSVELVGDSSGFAGRSVVALGTMKVSGTLGGPVEVQRDTSLLINGTVGGSVSVVGGQLTVDNMLVGDATVGGAGLGEGSGTVTGNGTIGGNLDIANGTLVAEAGKQLKVNGNLTLAEASAVNVSLGTPSSTALVSVGGDLRLDGNLSVSDRGGFGPGIYRLFNYGGTLTDNGLEILTDPNTVSAETLAIQTADRGAVNLVATGQTTFGYWDGGNAVLHDNATIDGGNGQWKRGERNWTTADGTSNGDPNDPIFAIFQGASGVVTVDSSAGDIAVRGMQFVTNGYRIEGDSVALIPLSTQDGSTEQSPASDQSVIRVGDGTASGASTVATIASSLTGGAQLAKDDLGTLILEGENTYFGGTEIRAGTLSISKDANLGNSSGALVFNGGTLNTTGSFDTARSLSVTSNSAINTASGTTLGLKGPIAGAGEWSKTGGGTLSIQGDGGAYAGYMKVQEGELNVASGGRLGGRLTVADGAALTGAGQVGTTTLQSGAVLAPSALGQAFNVLGDLTFEPGSRYVVSADPASSSSTLVVVSGIANLAGSVVQVGQGGNFDSSREYTILSADAVQGRFDGIASNYAYLDPMLNYSFQDVKLTLARKNGTNPIRFADAALTANQRATARALDALPSDNALHEYILTLPEGAPPAVFDNLSGEVHASLKSSLLASSSNVRTLPFANLRANLGADMEAAGATVQSGSRPSPALRTSRSQPAWAHVVGNWQTLKGDGNAAETKQRVGGLFIGADTAVGNGWRVGGAFGYTDGDIRINERASKADVSSYSATIYGGRAFDAGVGKANVMAGVSHTWHDIDTERTATVAGTGQKLKADYGANTTQLFTELGYAVPLSDRATIEPFVGVAVGSLRTRSFTENGGTAALRGKSSTDKQTNTTLGVRSQTQFGMGKTEGRLNTMLGWRHTFGEVLPARSLAFEGSPAFTVTGVPVARNVALVELGAEVAVSKNATIGLNYSGQYGGGNRDHSGMLDVRWRY